LSLDEFERELTGNHGSLYQLDQGIPDVQVSTIIFDGGAGPIYLGNLSLHSFPFSGDFFDVHVIIRRVRRFGTATLVLPLQ
jgi:hypothetical protein